MRRCLSSRSGSVPPAYDFVSDNAQPASRLAARAASMAAFNASKFVCSVMSLITLMISEIFQRTVA